MKPVIYSNNALPILNSDRRAALKKNYYLNRDLHSKKIFRLKDTA